MKCHTKSVIKESLLYSMIAIASFVLLSVAINLPFKIELRGALSLDMQNGFFTMDFARLRVLKIAAKLQNGVFRISLNGKNVNFDKPQKSNFDFASALGILTRRGCVKNVDTIARFGGEDALSTALINAVAYSAYSALGVNGKGMFVPLFATQTANVAVETTLRISLADAFFIVVGARK